MEALHTLINHFDPFSELEDRLYSKTLIYDLELGQRGYEHHLRMVSSSVNSTKAAEVLPKQLRARREIFSIGKGILTTVIHTAHLREDSQNYSRAHDSSPRVCRIEGAINRIEVKNGRRPEKIARSPHNQSVSGSQN